MGTMWRVEMLGNLQATSEDALVARFRTRRVGLLLAYLAYYSERSHSRDELAEMLWPESDPEQARRNLRQALSSLRHHLEPPSVPAGAVLISKQGRISLNPKQVSTDVGEFRELAGSPAKREKLKRAVELYRGDFLPGYYEDWVQRERLYLEDLLVSTLQQLIKASEEAGEINEAIRYVRLTLAKDHLKEDLHATLMRLYLASKRPASALQHFEEWRELLLKELNDEPGAEVRALAEQARRAGNNAPLAGMAGHQKATLEPGAPTAAEERSTISRLPVQLTRFFGRAQDLRRTIDYIAEQGVRLVTLWGPAGTGKTRLSVEAGRRLSEEHGWNVWFVPLADHDDGSRLFDAVADAMRLRKEAGNSLLDLLRANVEGSKNLLILDNLEHIIESAAPMVQTLLEAVPGVSIIATSRQSLKLPGEREIDLAALPVPDAEGSSLAELAETPSVQLFVDRAQSSLPDFQLTPNNAADISAICRKLDGLPLALEIAAGLSNAFTPSQLLRNLENRLEILRSRRRDLSGRHRSLRAAIDYSYELLSPELQEFFVALSVFRGGFNVEAASKVCLPSNGTQCLRMMLDVQERSLLRSDEAGEGCPARFRLLESFREYATERLDAKQDLALRRRHAEYFLELGKGSPAEMRDERENRLTALQFFFEQGQTHECVVLLEALHSFALLGQETIGALVRAPNFDSMAPEDQIMLLRLYANALLYPSDFETSYRVSMQALRIAEEMGKPDQVAICHRSVAVAAGYQGRRDDAIRHTEEFLAYAEGAKDQRMIEHGYSAIATEYWAKGDLEAALTAFQGAWRAATELHGSELPWPLLYNMGRVHLDLGRLDDGMQYAGEGLRVAQGQNDEFGISMCLALVSRYHRLRGSLVAALATGHEALVKRRKTGFLYWTLNAIQGQALTLVKMGRFHEAATLLAASRGTLKQSRVPDDNEFRAAVAKGKENLPDEEFERAWAEGLGMSMEEAFRFALRQA